MSTQLSGHNAYVQVLPRLPAHSSCRAHQIHRLKAVHPVSHAKAIRKPLEAVAAARPCACKHHRSPEECLCCSGAPWRSQSQQPCPVRCFPALHSKPGRVQSESTSTGPNLSPTLLASPTLSAQPALIRPPARLSNWQSEICPLECTSWLPAGPKHTKGSDKCNAKAAQTLQHAAQVSTRFALKKTVHTGGQPIRAHEAGTRLVHAAGAVDMAEHAGCIQHMCCHHRHCEHSSCSTLPPAFGNTCTARGLTQCGGRYSRFQSSTNGFEDG